MIRMLHPETDHGLHEAPTLSAETRDHLADDLDARREALHLMVREVADSGESVAHGVVDRLAGALEYVAEGIGMFLRGVFGTETPDVSGADPSPVAKAAGVGMKVSELRDLVEARHAAQEAGAKLRHTGHHGPNHSFDHHQVTTQIHGAERLMESLTHRLQEAKPAAKSVETPFSSFREPAPETPPAEPITEKPKDVERGVPDEVEARIEPSPAHEPEPEPEAPVAAVAKDVERGPSEPIEAILVPPG